MNINKTSLTIATMILLMLISSYQVNCSKIAFGSCFAVCLGVLNGMSCIGQNCASFYKDPIRIFYMTASGISCYNACKFKI